MEIEHVEFTSGRPSLEIPSIDFHGSLAVSPNGTFNLGWEDCDYQGRASGHVRGGAREGGMGRVVLVCLDRQVPQRSENSRLKRTAYEGKLLWQQDVERPNHGAVANTGHAIVNDW